MNPSPCLDKQWVDDVHCNGIVETFGEVHCLLQTPTGVVP
ncbi:hypothetical protein AM1_3857 [Acaryochloris marina MBIC11017]|uniref:Uncharacterized protein n=1 Tax=Acaryochloris marina (strain MBIC 11017) TaxID=329726 RepID=B0C703_ACAM1|nr:hypothetical protein AM1_3857 [Acaryochloris marina MBIC11017]